MPTLIDGLNYFFYNSMYYAQKKYDLSLKYFENFIQINEKLVLLEKSYLEREKIIC